jgi:hypothetical protein
MVELCVAFGVGVLTGAVLILLTRRSGDINVAVNNDPGVWDEIKDDEKGEEKEKEEDDDNWWREGRGPAGVE